MPGKLFAGTPLAANRVAASFVRVDLALPDVAVTTARGPRRLPQLAGRARLMTLWAEWCIPCLLEARDLAAAQAVVAGGAIDIVSVLTGSSAKLDYAAATERLHHTGADGLTLLVEPDGGRAIAEALSTRPPPPPNLAPGDRVSGFALPCTLLVDRRGRVRGRATGIASAVPLRVTGSPGGAPGVPHKLSDEEKQAMLSNGSKTAWSAPDGLAFLHALHDGALDRV